MVFKFKEQALKKRCLAKRTVHLAALECGVFFDLTAGPNSLLSIYTRFLDERGHVMKVERRYTRYPEIRNLTEIYPVGQSLFTFQNDPGAHFRDRKNVVVHRG